MLYLEKIWPTDELYSVLVNMWGIKCEILQVTASVRLYLYTKPPRDNYASTQTIDLYVCFQCRQCSILWASYTTVDLQYGTAVTVDSIAAVQPWKKGKHHIVLAKIVIHKHAIIEWGVVKVWNWLNKSTALNIIADEQDGERTA